jgi:hypothetical protein
LVRGLALKFYRCVLDDQCVLSALTFQSLALVQLSVGNVMREALNARGCELLSSRLLLDQYLCSDVLALTLFLLQGQQMLALLFRELVIWELQRSCGLPFALLYGVACLWQHDELFRAQWYVFVE